MEIIFLLLFTILFINICFMYILYFSKNSYNLNEINKSSHVVKNNISQNNHKSDIDKNAVKKHQTIEIEKNETYPKKWMDTLTKSSLNQTSLENNTEKPVYFYKHNIYKMELPINVTLSSLPNSSYVNSQLFDYSTRGPPTEVRQIGYLSNNKSIIPLYGFQNYRGSDQWIYYALIKTNGQYIKLPITHQNRDCLGSFCKEIYDGDTIIVNDAEINSEESDRSFRSHIYKKSFYLY